MVRLISINNTRLDDIVVFVPPGDILQHLLQDPRLCHGGGGLRHFVTISVSLENAVGVIVAHVGVVVIHLKFRNAYEKLLLFLVNILPNCDV